VGEQPDRIIASVARSDVAPVELPGREWGLLLGPDNVGATHLTLGFADFPGGSAPLGHVHPTEEEMMYVLSGSGRLISGDQALKLEPGVAVYVPPGVSHSTVADPNEPLRLITVFSPPVVPGSYEPASST
jgi:putative monooxygenase